MKSKSVLFAALAAVTAIWVTTATARGQIFVVNSNLGTIGEYTTSGATVNASLVTGLYGTGPGRIAVSGSNLFVANAFNGTIGEYTTSGATVNASLSTGLNDPQGIAVSGLNLFVTNVGSNTIGEYTTSGATVNASLITELDGLSGPLGIVVVPEPSTWAMLAIGSGALLAFRHHKKRAGR